MNLCESMKISTLAYWLSIKHHFYGGIEIKDADVLTVTKVLKIVESEIKISIPDLQSELTNKRKHILYMNKGYSPPYTLANRFYFVVPDNLLNKAKQVCSERYPNAGILSYKFIDNDIYNPKNINLVKESYKFKPNPDYCPVDLNQIAYGTCMTMMRYIKEYVKE